MTDHIDKLRASLSGQYTVDHELAGGGMSRVYVAHETRLNRKVVIKVVSPELAQGLSIERFEREIQLAASLSQANIVPLLSAGDTNGLPYFTMPFVDGESLRHKLSHGPLAIVDVVNILRDVARALSYAHRQGVVHRDIKPDNVLLSAGAAVVTDFGIAKAISAAKTQGGGEQLTQTGTSIGTAAYMAPEQAAGDPHVDQRADIYSLGCMAYELLTGKPPFVRESVQRVIAAQLTEAPQPLAESRADAPPALALLVMQCLEKDPARRPQAADEVLHQLDQVHLTGGRALGATSNANRARLPIYVFAATVAVAVVVALLIFRHPGPGGASTGIRSLAVLPIENVGGDSTKEYLADGMTGELAGNLRQTPGLEVVGDLSTARFKRSQLAPSEIANQLHVGMLLSGKLQSQGNSIRLQMQLNDGDGKLLWSQKFDREMKDNFALQDDITAAVASELRVVLSPQTIAATRAGRTENTEAHLLYLRGVSEKNKLSAEGLKNAEVLFKQAIALDPNYAQAHEGLGFTYDIQADVFAPSHEYHTLALKEARRAVQADSLLGEARVLLGFEEAAANWDFEAGLAEMNRGLRLNPRSPDGLFMLMGFSLLSGDTKRAIALGDSLLLVDPLSPLAAHVKAETRLWDGQWETALAAKRAAVKLDSTVSLIEATDGLALMKLGRLDEALAAFLAFRKRFDLPSFGLVMTYGQLGRKADGLREIHLMEDRFRTSWVDPTMIAIMYAGIGDHDHAMAWLDTAVVKKAWFVRLFMNWNTPWLRNMQDDPRYIALKKKVLATTFSE